MSFPRVHIVGVMALVQATTLAQITVGPPIRVDTQNGNSGVETAVVVSATNPLELIAGAIDWRLGINQGPRIGYAVSLNGGGSFTRRA